MTDHFSRRAAMAGIAAFAVAPLARAQSATAYAAAARYSSERDGVSVLVMQAGRILFEDYANAGGPDAGWELASGTKSFCGAIAAAGVRDGLLSLDERCADTLSEWRADTRRDITIRQLLTLTSGLAPGSIGRPQAYAEAIHAPSLASPGARFAYGPGPFQTFGEIMQRKLEGRFRDPAAYLQARVLEPIGVRPTRWRRGVDGNSLLPQGAQFSARAWARFGQWVLDGGRGVDPDVIGAFHRGTIANPGYGLTWWLLRPGLIPPSDRMMISVTPEAAREDVSMAAGAGNQRLYLLRRRGLVVVRQGTLIRRNARSGGWSDTQFLRLLLGSA